MPLELRIEPDGTVRPFWYGRFKIEGKRFCQNLGVKVAGNPPASRSLMDQGDTAFEVSRASAMAELKHIVEEARTKRDSARLVEKLYEIKTGEQIKSVRLEDLGEEWARIPRKREPNARYASQCKSALKRFAEFVRQENPKADELAHVTRALARAFMDAEAKRGVTAKTWNDMLKLLRATCKYLLPAGAINPFSDTPTKETETVFRKPFTPEELKLIVDAARDDDFIRPLIVTGMCTAMRRGDCCLLKWQDVDLEREFITVKTAKTGVTVSIPVFPMLREELERKAEGRNRKIDTSPNPLPVRGGEGAVQPASAGAGGARNRQAGSLPYGKGAEGYVFPEQARMYLENPDGITMRVKKVLAVALGADQGDEKDENALPVVSCDEARERGREYISKLPNGAKKERMKAIFDLYMTGKKLCLVADEIGVSKGTVSGHLNEIERAVGCRIVRGKAEGRRQKAGMAELLEEREDGLRRASVRDFHSFRVTWVTLALTAGVPLELVQKVTGHKTTDIVLKHYFQPGREEFRQALNAAMPKLLTNGHWRGKAESGKRKAETEQIREIAEATTARTWKMDMARIVELLEKC